MGFGGDDEPSDVDGEATSAPDAKSGSGDALAAPTENGPGPGTIDMDRISKEVDRLFDLVPEIGSRWRWYDVPYRLLNSLVRSWRRRFMPWRLRRLVNRGLNFLISFNEYERFKVESLEDPRDNLIVPDSEQVTQGGIWVVDLFPPSHAARLRRSLQENGWDKDSHLTTIYGTNAEQVSRARRGRGFTWVRLGSVARQDSLYLVPDAKREALPPEFALIELRAVQLGRSVTAVVAFVELSEAGQRSLNAVWTRQHEPTLEWNGLRRPTVHNRLFAGLHATQAERQRLHDLARRWLASRCPGFFADASAGQPVVDFSVFAQFDPTAEIDHRALGDPLRALGMDTNHLHNYVSPQMPGCVLVPGGTPGDPPGRLKNCWGVIGNYDKVAEHNDRLGYGAKPYTADTVARMLNDAIRVFALHVAVLGYLDEVRGLYAVARDEARNQHRRYSPRAVKRLRSSLLTTSLDLSVVARDTAILWSERWTHWQGIEVSAEVAPGITAPLPESYDVLEEFGKTRERDFAELLKEDADYREVLSTVASLGASAEASRLARRSLLAALLTLLVATVTLLVANTGNGNTLWSDLVHWLAH